MVGPERAVGVRGRHVVCAVDTGYWPASDRQRPGLGDVGSHGHYRCELERVGDGSYLGAVSHTGDAGLIGLTLVNVQS